MDLRKMMVVCAVALSGLAVGCKSDTCKSTCEDAKKCSDATATDKARDCGKFCDDVDNLSDSANCNSQKDKLVDCEDGADACDANACASQQTAWGTCIGVYCAAHSNDANCTAVFGDI